MDEQEKTYWTDNDELVEKYVLGQISEEEKIAMELEIVDCLPCKQKLLDEMEMAAGIRRYGRDAIAHRLRTALKREGTSQFTTYQFIGLAAAVVVVALAIGAYEIWFSDLESPKQFTSQEFELIYEDEDTLNGQFNSEIEGDINSDNEIPKDESSAQEPVSTTSSENQLSNAIEAESIKPTASGNTSSVKSKPSPKIAMADADDVSPSKESALTNNTSSIWLIGEVVMIGESTHNSIRSISKSESTGRNDDLTRKKSVMEQQNALQSAPMNVEKRYAKDEGIILKQRDIKGLPSDLAQQSSNQPQSVQTLLERTDNGVQLTLFGNAVNGSELQQAVIETLTNDSLIVSLPNQRIAFRLPSGWNPQSTNTR